MIAAMADLVAVGNWAVNGLPDQPRPNNRAHPTLEHETNPREAISIEPADRLAEHAEDGAVFGIDDP